MFYIQANIITYGFLVYLVTFTAVTATLYNTVSGLVTA